MRDWQRVYRDPQQYRAEIVRSILDDHELSPVMLSKKDSAYHFGYFDILVAPEHVIKALKIINEEITFE